MVVENREFRFSAGGFSTLNHLAIAKALKSTLLSVGRAEKMVYLHSKKDF